MNDVKWRAYLVRHILHELRLLFTGLTCQQGGLLQLLSALLGFVLRMFCIADMLADASPHLAEAVLQLSYQVGALTWGKWILVVPVSNLAQFRCQKSQRLYKMAYDSAAAHNQMQQTCQTDDDCIALQRIIGTEDVALRAYDGYTPSGILKGVVDDEIGLAIDVHLTMAGVARLHRYGCQVGITVNVAVGLIEVRLVLLQRVFRMYDKMSVSTHHCGVGVRERLQREYEVGKPFHRDMCRQHPDKLALVVAKWHAVRRD